MKPTWRGLGAEMPIKESYVCLLQFGKGLIFVGMIHFIPSQWDFVCLCLFICYSHFPWLLTRKWIRSGLYIQTSWGVFLYPSVLIHAKSQRISDFERAGESALLEACACRHEDLSSSPSTTECAMWEGVCVQPQDWGAGDGRSPCCPASLAESVGLELSDRSCLRKEGGA